MKRLKCVAAGTCGSFSGGSVDPADATGPAIISKNVGEIACINWGSTWNQFLSYGAVRTCIQPGGSISPETAPLEFFVATVSFACTDRSHACWLTFTCPLASRCSHAPMAD